MSFVPQILGIGNGSDSSGFNYRASPTNLVTPATADQANSALSEVNSSIENQQAFLNALQAQNGIQNQSNVFNQMQGVANGTGPDPALAQLNQATSANTDNQAALMADQRGASSNAGLITRLAGMQGGQNQQNAAGQGATLKAQQQLNALNNLGGLANTQVSQQANATNALTNAGLNNYQNINNAIANQNNASVGMQSNINSNNAAINQQLGSTQGAIIGQLLGGAGKGLQFSAKGGKVSQVKNYAVGGDISFTPEQVRTPLEVSPAGRPTIDAGKALTDAANNARANKKPLDTTQPDAIKGAGSMFPETAQPLPAQNIPEEQPLFHADPLSPSPMGMPDQPTQTVAHGGEIKKKVPVMLSPGEKYLTPEQAKAVVHGKENPLNGKTIPGQAKVKGDSLKNDIVPATLEEGGCVIPRSVLESKEPMKEAIKFVHKHIRMSKGGKVK